MTMVNGSSPSDRQHCLLSTSVIYPLITVNSLGCLFGTFGNILVWVAVFKNTRLQTLTNYFLLSLALADMFVTGITQPLFVARNILVAQNKCIVITSTAYKLAAYFSCMASILNLTAISIDRLISLKYPLQKKTILPKRRGFMVIAVTWILALLYTTISYILEESNKAWLITTFVYFAVCYLTMIVTHSYMYVVSHRFVQRRNLQTRRSSFSMISYTKERQAAKTVTIIITVFTIAWMPYVFGLVFSAASDVVLHKAIGYPLFTIGLLNSSVNPVLYSWRNKEFRTTFCQLLKCQDPNLIRRESVSSFYLSRSRISTVSTLFNDCNALNTSIKSSTQVIPNLKIQEL